MKKVCKPFAGGTLPEPLRKGFNFAHVPSEIQRLANAFVESQDRRDQADYDLTEPLRRKETLSLIKIAEEAIDTFAQLPGLQR